MIFIAFYSFTDNYIHHSLERMKVTWGDFKGRWTETSDANFNTLMSDNESTIEKKNPQWKL